MRQTALAFSFLGLVLLVTVPVTGSAQTTWPVDRGVREGFAGVHAAIDPGSGGLRSAHAGTCTDEDGDGYALEGGDCGPVDCEDADPGVHPGAEEVCDYADNQCPGDAGHGEVDEGCGLTLLEPAQGALLTDPPTFSWTAGLSDRFCLYLVVPMAGIGVQTFTLPMTADTYLFPEWFWASGMISGKSWCGWLVVGVDRTPEEFAWETSEMRFFKKASP